jgi:hypothetical protein
MASPQLALELADELPLLLERSLALFRDVELWGEEQRLSSIVEAAFTASFDVSGQRERLRGLRPVSFEAVFANERAMRHVARAARHVLHALVLLVGAELRDEEDGTRLALSISSWRAACGAPGSTTSSCANGAPWRRCFASRS